jgi:hypothetical protein
MIRSVRVNALASRIHRNGGFALTAALVVFLATILIVWSPPPVAMADTNGVANPSFETAGTSASDAASWTEGTNHVRSGDRFHSGGWSIKSTFTGTGTSTRGSAITVSPNRSYVLSGWIYKAATAGAAYIDMFDIPGELNLNATQTNVWEFVSGTWNSGTTTSVTIRLVTDHTPNGSIWFDDIALEPANILANPSFETAGATSADAASWTEGSSHARASDGVHGGGWALRSTYTGAGTSTRSAAITVTPDTTYTLSGYIWATNSAGNAYIDMLDIPGELTLPSRQTGTWEFLSGTWNSGSRTSVTLRLVTDGSPTAAIWFDDITFSVTTSDVVVAGAGDISCDPQVNLPPPPNCQQQQTSDVLMQIDPDVVLTFGDNQYDSGELTKFQTYYDPTWGRLKARTRPSVGNHEYQKAPATGYFDYFNGIGNATGPAGDRTKGYYSFDSGAWHIMVINSNCNKITGTTNGADCAVGSPQYTWLQNDLATHPNRCTLAYWHHPLFSVGTHYQDADLKYVKPIFQLLYDNNADLVLNGHDHNYQRWTPQDPNGNRDTVRGIREIVVGTGGRDLSGFPISSANVEARNRNVFGVIKLTLHPSSYDWQFVPEAGQTWAESGSTACH